jgi:hypothetical protein
VSLAPLLPPAAQSEELAAALCRSLVVDLFQAPQREAYRFPVMQLTSNGLSQHEIAWELDITQTAVQRAAALSRSMDKLGVADPYLPLTAPPDDYAKLRRHKHPRYRFEPLQGQAAQVHLATDRQQTQVVTTGEPLPFRGWQGLFAFPHLIEEKPMSNHEQTPSNPSKPEPSRKENTRTLLLRLLEMLAAHIVEKLLRRSPSEPGENANNSCRHGSEGR